MYSYVANYAIISQHRARHQQESWGGNVVSTRFSSAREPKRTRDRKKTARNAFSAYPGSVGLPFSMAKSPYGKISPPRKGRSAKDYQYLDLFYSSGLQLLVLILHILNPHRILLGKRPIRDSKAELGNSTRGAYVFGYRPLWTCSQTLPHRFQRCRICNLQKFYSRIRPYRTILHANRKRDIELQIDQYPLYEEVHKDSSDLPNLWMRTSLHNWALQQGQVKYRYAPRAIRPC